MKHVLGRFNPRKRFVTLWVALGLLATTQGYKTTVQFSAADATAVSLAADPFEFGSHGFLNVSVDCSAFVSGLQLHLADLTTYQVVTQ